MVPRLIHHLLRLCAIIVSIVCSSVLTVCAPFHLFCFFCSHSFAITVLSFSFSVSSARLFQFVCQSPQRAAKRALRIYVCTWFECIIGDASRRHTGVPSRLKYSKTEYIYMQLCITRAEPLAPCDMSPWVRE